MAFGKRFMNGSSENIAESVDDENEIYAWHLPELLARMFKARHP